MAMTRSVFCIMGVMAVMFCSLPSRGADACAEVTQFLMGKATGVACFHTDHLTTHNPSTTNPITPPNNSILKFADGTPLPGSTVLGGALGFTPITDRGVIS